MESTTMKNRQLVLLAAMACVGAALSKPVTGQDLQQPHPIPPTKVCQPLVSLLSSFFSSSLQTASPFPSPSVFLFSHIDN